MNLTKEEYKHLKFDMYDASSDMLLKAVGHKNSRSDFNAGFEAGIEWVKHNPPPPEPKTPMPEPRIQKDGKYQGFCEFI